MEKSQFQIPCDILVEDRPIQLAQNAPDIFNDYVISPTTAISIQPSLNILLADETFRCSIRKTLGEVSLVDIKVCGNGQAVLVKNPQDANSSYRPVDFSEQAAIQEIANRTQEAYRLFKARQTSAQPPTIHSHSFEPLPGPTAHPTFYESRINSLERESYDLRQKVETLELERQLRQSEQLRLDAMHQVKLAHQENSTLKEAIDSLRGDLEKKYESFQNTNAYLQTAILANLCLCAALFQMGGKNTELEKQLEILQTQNRKLQHDSDFQQSFQQAMQQLAQADSPTTLIKRIKEMQSALTSEEEAIGRLKCTLEASEERGELLQGKLAFAEQKLSQLVNKLQASEQLKKAAQEKTLTLEDKISQIEQADQAKKEEAIKLRKQLEAEKEGLAQAQQGYTQALSQLQKELDSTQNSLNSHQEEASKKDQTIQDLEKKASQLEVVIQEKASLISQHALRTQKLEEEIKTGKKELSNLKDQLLSAQKSLAEKETKSSQLEAEILELQKAKQAIQDTLQEAAALNKEQGAHIEALSKQLAQEELKKTSQKTTINTLTNQVADLEKEVMSLKTQRSSQEANLTSLINDLNEKKAALTAAQEDQQKKRKDVEELKKVLEQAAKERAKSERAKEEAQNSQSTLEKQLQASNKERDSLLSSVSQLTEALGNAKVELDAAQLKEGAKNEEAIALTKTTTSLQEEISRLKALLEEIDLSTQEVPIEQGPCSLLEELAAIPTDYSHLPEEVKKTFQALLKKGQAVKNGEQSIIQLKAELKDLELQLEAEKILSTKTQGDFEKKIEELENLNKTSLDKVNADIKEKADLIEKLRQSLENERVDKKKTVDALKETLSYLQEDNHKLEQANKMLRQESEEKDDTIKGKERCIEILEKESEDLCSQEKDLKNSIIRLEQTLKESEALQKNWEKEANNLSKDHNNLQAQYASLKIHRNQLQEECVQLREILATTLAIEDPNREIDDLKKESRSLLNRVEKMTVSIEELTHHAMRTDQLSQFLLSKHWELLEEQGEAYAFAHEKAVLALNKEAQINFLQKERADNKQALNQKERELKTLQEEQAEFIRGSEELITLLERIDEITSTFQPEEEARSLASELEEALSQSFSSLERDSQTLDFGNLPEKVQTLLESYLTQNRELEIAKHHLQARQVDTSDLEKQLREKEVYAEAMQDRLEDELTQLEEELQLEKEGFELKIQEKEREIENLRKTLAKERSGKEEELKKSQREIEHLEEDFQALRETLIHKLKEKEAAVEQAEQTANYYQSNLQSLLESGNKTPDIEARHQKALKENETKTDQLRERTKELLIEAEELRSKYERACRLLSKLEEERSNLREVLANVLDVSPDLRPEEFRNASDNLLLSHKRTADQLTTLTEKWANLQEA